MKDDVLREATRALREQAAASRASPAETRARVMRTLKAQRARRHTAVRVLVPMAAVLVGSVAWASATRWFPETWNDIASQLGLSAAQVPEAPPAPPTPRSAPRRAAEAEAPAPLEPAPSAEAPAPPEPAPSAEAIAPPEPAPSAEALALAPSPPPAPSAAPVSARPRRAKTPAPQRAARPAPSAASREAGLPPEPATASPLPAPPPAAPDADALYQAAHRAHFVERNPAAALAAWDVYLAAAPRGRFSVEAQYNRALCLVRLGRADEAQRALEPFARGAFGAYRQTDARVLIDALRGDAARDRGE
ncbi:tetratricopeptide repeat protein [Sorangium sp. So ce131]|uniref:tetratricopeptide repeat protein n=1 Tax=Sorangium sp. So ce131 TaxID=3133282 RepID=UPI003F607B6F